MPELLKLLERISAGDLPPEVIVTHRLPLVDAVRGCETFNEKRECVADHLRIHGLEVPPVRGDRCAAQGVAGLVAGVGQWPVAVLSG